MLMPDPDQNVINRRDEICAELRKLVPVECVIDSKESMKAFDADGLSAYRQLPWLSCCRKLLIKLQQS